MPDIRVVGSHRDGCSIAAESSSANDTHYAQEIAAPVNNALFPHKGERLGHALLRPAFQEEFLLNLYRAAARIFRGGS